MGLIVLLALLVFLRIRGDLDLPWPHLWVVLFPPSHYRRARAGHVDRLLLLGHRDGTDKSIVAFAGEFIGQTWSMAKHCHCHYPFRGKRGSCLSNSKRIPSLLCHVLHTITRPWSDIFGPPKNIPEHKPEPTEL